MTPLDRHPRIGADILTMLEDGATGTGRVRFLPDTNDAPLSAVWHAAGRASARLDHLAGEAGTVAGILTPSLAPMAALIGAWRAGLRFVSIPLPGRAVDPNAYLTQVVEMCAASGATTLLLGADYLSLLPPVEGIEVVAAETLLEPGPAAAVDREGGRLVQFSSGSTGAPKGISLSMAAIGANVSAILEFLEVGRGDSCASWLPLSHDMGLIGMALASLAAGSSRVADASLTLLPPELFLRDPRRWLGACSELGATITGAPNFALDLAGKVGLDPGADLSGLRVIITGGERVRGDTLRRFDANFAAAGLPATALCPAYGMAEATLAVTMVPPARRWSSTWVDRFALGDGSWSECGAGEGIEVVSNGCCLPGMSVRLDPHGPDGLAELEVAGPSLFDAYVGAPTRLVDDVWFHTADLAAVVDGETFIMGRTDDVILVAGRNYYATDLEAAVSDVSVRPGNVAAIQTRDGRYALLAEPAKGVDVADLRAAAVRIRNEQVRRSGTGPTTVTFLTPGSLPKTPSGKIRRSAVSASFDADRLDVVHQVEFGRSTSGAGPAT